MAGGYNTNLERAGRVLHLQTQPRWRDPRIVETMVYDGGRIVASCVTTRPAGESPEGWMREQHRRLIEEIERGLHDAAIDPSTARPAAEEAVPSREALARVLERLERHVVVGQAAGVEAPAEVRPRRRVRVGIVIRWRAWAAILPVALLLIAVVAWAPGLETRQAAVPPAPVERPTALAPAPYRLEAPPLVEVEPAVRPETAAATEPSPPAAEPRRPPVETRAPAVTPTETVAVIPSPAPVEGPVEPEVAPPNPPPAPIERAIEPRVERVPARPTVRGLPDYPRRARRQGLEGTVPLTLGIDVRGRVTTVGAEPSDADPALIAAAIAAARDWRFAPATVDGRPTEERRRVAIRFEVSRDRSEVVRVVEDRPL